MSLATAGMPTLAEMANRFWTLPDLDDLDGRFFELHKIEIVDGRLIVSNRPSRQHADIVRRLLERLMAVLPPDLVALSDIYVDLPRTSRSPDVVVIARRLLSRDVCRETLPGDVLLAIEVESPGSVTEDRQHKPAEYAEAGIPAYWHVTQDEPPLITVFSLNVTGSYDEVGAPAVSARWPYPVDLSSGS